MKRREFLQAAGGLAAVGAGVSQGVALQEKPAAPTERIGVGVMGLRGRGGALLTAFAAMPDVEVRYVCDVDAKVLASRADRKSVV